MDLLKWLETGSFLNGAEHDYRWVIVTAVLSASVLLGYVVISFNWYFQSRLAQRSVSRRTLLRLGRIAALCVLAGAAFLLWDMGWSIWRLYDIGLALLAVYTWSCVTRMRGVGLVEDRIRQFEQLEKTAAQYRDLAELLPQMVWTATADGRIDYSNQTWRDYAAGDESWVEAIHPEEASDVTEWWRDAIAGNTRASREIRLRGRSGGYRTFLVNATPISNGPMSRWLGACADIEDQKLLVAEKERQAKERMFFLNALSHDLRAPLNNVVLTAELLKMLVDDSDRLECARTILENAVAAAELVSQLLDYARTGVQERCERETVRIEAVLQQIERRFAPVVASKGLYLNVAVEPCLTLVTDRGRLERLLSNLVDNAVKYTSRGGITIDALSSDDRVVVRISDTGHGVAERHAERLFDEFYQVGNNERDPRKGFGMGLAICKNLARQLGGDIRLASTGPSGSSFEVIIGDVDHDRRGQRDSAADNGRHIEAPRLCAV